MIFKDKKMQAKPESASVFFTDKIELVDAASIKDSRTDRNGFIHTKAKIARSGIYIYGGFEVGLPQLKEVRVYRPPEEVFHHDSMNSYRHLPLTDDHPSEDVSPVNVRTYQIGSLGTDVERVDDHIVCSVAIYAKEAIESFLAGNRELSSGHSAEIHFNPGQDPEGNEYDAVMRGIRANHVAMVDRGRCGASCRLIDKKVNDCGCGGSCDPCKSKPKTKPKLHEDTKTMLVKIKGHEVEVSDAAGLLIEQQNESLTTANTSLETANTTIATKDTELATLQAKLDKAEADLKDAKAALSPEAMNKRVADRQKFLVNAKKLKKDLKVGDKSNEEIVTEILTDKLGAEKIAGKSADYLSTYFDALVDQVKDKGTKERDGIDFTDADFVDDNEPEGYGDMIKDKDNYQSMFDGSADA